MAPPVVGLIMGVMFGSSLVLAGLTDPDKIIGTLRLKDLHALRTVAVFVLVGMLGTWILESGEAANLNIKPAAILTVLIGGAFLGMGLGLTGFCPGTGLASAASGRIDAVVTVVGMLFGAHVYILVYPSIALPLERIANYGSVTLPQITGTSAASWIVPILAAGSVALFLTRARKPRDAELRDKAEDLRMSEDYSGAEGLALATDCVEPARMFGRWKDYLFMIIVLCLLLLQASFWLVSTGRIEMDNDSNGNTASVFGDGEKRTGEAAEPPVTKPKESAGAGAVAAPPKKPMRLWLFAFDATFERATLVVCLANAILVFASVLYALAMFCCLTVSLGGRLGGLSHICRAFYLSLIVLILLLPWQILFRSAALGAIYTPDELVKAFTADTSGMFSTVLFYLRFTGCWALVALVLILAQFRSLRWTKAVLRRLDPEV
jgi:uncharacterized membrane protein YedE/YeeE